jgi:uncharacterized protein (DUF2336 family)
MSRFEFFSSFLMGLAYLDMAWRIRDGPRADALELAEKDQELQNRVLETGRMENFANDIHEATKTVRTRPIPESYYST